MFTEADLDHAKRMVRSSEEQIHYQQRIIDALRAIDQPTSMADRFLERLEETLKVRKEHRNAVGAYLYSLELDNNLILGDLGGS